MFNLLRILRLHVRCRPLELPEETGTLATSFNFELQSQTFTCQKEELRAPRNVRVGVFQHKLPLPTWSSIEDQRKALYKLAAEAVNTAASGGVNIFSFQEAWSVLNVILKHFAGMSTHFFCFRYAVCVLYPREASLVRICRIGRKRSDD